jgi:hypothetical protein
MQAASVVEAILCWVTTRDRATAIVGDLVEIREQKGTVWFWLSAAGVLLSLVWRWPIAFVASFYAGAWSFAAFLMATTGINAHHPQPDYPWGLVVEGLVFVGSCAVALSVFACIRYGLRDRATQMVLAWGTLATAVIYLWWVPAVLLACITGAVALGFYSICTRQGRRSSIVVWSAIVVGVCGFFWWAAIGTLYQNWLKPGLWGSDDILQHPSLGWLIFSAMLLGQLAKLWVWSWLRDLLAGTREVEAPSEML